MKSNIDSARIAIVDYGLGNLFSVKHACERAGMTAFITRDQAEISEADGVLLPGVGAFGDAMQCLHSLELVEPLRQVAHSGKPLVGVCLGMQLLMSESFEFGRHAGLDLLEGQVVRFESPAGAARTLKVPQVGWNRITRPAGQANDPWLGTPLAGMPEGVAMYFVHSFYVQPRDPSAVLSMTRYGHIEFCSALRRRNVLGFQFHPERSGPAGLQIYRMIAEFVTQCQTN